MNKLNVTSRSLSNSVQSFFLCLDSFILSLYVACLPVCVKIVQKIVKPLRIQTLHTVVMEFPETRSSILVHTISEMSHTFIDQIRQNFIIFLYFHWPT